MTSSEERNILLHVTARTRARLRKWHKAIADRDEAIRDARAEGGSLREIAELVGLSHTEVRRILSEKGAKK